MRGEFSADQKIKGLANRRRLSVWTESPHRATQGLWCNQNIQKQPKTWHTTAAVTYLFWACADCTCAGAKASPCFCRTTNHTIAYCCLTQAVPDSTQNSLAFMQYSLLACAAVSLRNCVAILRHARDIALFWFTCYCRDALRRSCSHDNYSSPSVCEILVPGGTERGFLTCKDSHPCCRGVARDLHDPIPQTTTYLHACRKSSHLCASVVDLVLLCLVLPRRCWVKVYEGTSSISSPLQENIGTTAEPRS